jgi:hypothetical protein
VECDSLCSMVLVDNMRCGHLHTKKSKRQDGSAKRQFLSISRLDFVIMLLLNC